MTWGLYDPDGPSLRHEPVLHAVLTAALCIGRAPSLGPLTGTSITTPTNRIGTPTGRMDTASPAALGSRRATVLAAVNLGGWGS